MESANAGDSALASVLPADMATRLLRVFCFLRQHERKAKAARKLAELQAWSRAQSEQPPRPSRDEADQPTEDDRDRSAIVDELDQMRSGVTAAVSLTPALVGVSQPPKEPKQVDAKTLHRDLRELQKGILGSSDTSGSITAGDLASALRAMNRPSSKAEVQWMIWEADDDLDGALTWDEFRAAYVRAARDRLALEPNQLYHLVLFLLCDADNSQSVSALELTTELRRITRSDQLADSLMAALGTDAEGQLMRRFSLAEFLRVTHADLPASFPLH